MDIADKQTATTVDWMPQFDNHREDASVA